MKGSEIKSYTFDKSAFGYKTEEVEACLRDVSAYTCSLEEKLGAAEAKMAALEKQNAELSANEESVKEIIVSAQKLSSTVVGEAKIKAKNLLEDAEQKSAALTAEAVAKSDQLIAEAKEKAQTITEKAQKEYDALTAETKKEAKTEEAHLHMMKSEVSKFKSTLLTLYKSHLDIITKLPEIEPEEEESVPKEEPKKEIASETISPAKEKEAERSDRLTEPEVSRASEPKAQKKTKTTGTKKTEKPAFKITITENRAEDKKKKEVVRAASEENKFQSRFGELHFGENTSDEL